MERYLELFQKANDYFKTADHLAYVTYELVQEPKLLLTILDNLNLALKHKTDSLLEYERLYKRISPIPQNQELKLNLAEKCLRRYNLSNEMIHLIREVNSILEQHKKSPIAFGKGEKFVICSENYRTKTINIQEVKEYIVSAREYLSKLDKVLLKNE
ncbi:hypothetical protein J4403_01450 [Candidatus Woesearchaeota archaeon]|nr:hypothetical protein [Candidatus Woesearchaeota archaeon]